ncbi:hypothetical protein D9M71_555500 [compost metagenome]
MQHRRAVAGTGGDFMAAGTQAEQADIHQGQADTGDQAGDDRVAGDQPRRLDAAGTDGVDDDDTEHQRTEGIHGQVTIDEALGERRGDVSRLRFTDTTGWQHERGDAERGQGDDLQRCEEAADGVEQLARVHGHRQYHQEVHQAVDEQGQRAFTGQRCNTYFEGYGGGTRGGEQRAYREVAHRRQQAAGDLADRAAQGIHAAADLGQGNDSDDRQAHSSDQETQRRHPHVWTGLQTDDRWENDIARTDEQRERHKTKCQDVLAFQHFH